MTLSYVFFWHFFWLLGLLEKEQNNKEKKHTTQLQCIAVVGH